MFKKFILAAMAALSITISPVIAAEHRITFHPGGSLGVEFEKLDKWYKAKDTVVIDGVCLSACTLVTGLIPADRLCATDRAIMGFHSAYSINPLDGSPVFSSEATRLIWQIYPKKVRDLLFEAGWEGPQEHMDLVYIPADKIFKSCNREIEYGEAN